MVMVILVGNHDKIELLECLSAYVTTVHATVVAVSLV